MKTLTALTLSTAIVCAMPAPSIDILHPALYRRSGYGTWGAPYGGEWGARAAYGGGIGTAYGGGIGVPYGGGIGAPYGGGIGAPYGGGIGAPYGRNIGVPYGGGIGASYGGVPFGSWGYGGVWPFFASNFANANNFNTNQVSNLNAVNAAHNRQVLNENDVLSVINANNRSRKNANNFNKAANVVA